MAWVDATLTGSKAPHHHKAVCLLNIFTELSRAACTAAHALAPVCKAKGQEGPQQQQFLALLTHRCKLHTHSGCIASTQPAAASAAGREAFLEQVFAWVKTYGGKIFGQMRRMGISVDWDRLAFTMDDNLVGAVQEAFVMLHQEGLIYRENRLVNWCCTLHTAVSDIEVGCLRPPSRTAVHATATMLLCTHAPILDLLVSLAAD